MPASARCLVARIVTILTCVLLCWSVSAGQEQSQGKTDKGAISGTVTDPTHVGVPDAEVVLTSSVGPKLSIPVNEKGAFSVTGLWPGTYSLTISASGSRTRCFPASP